MVPGNVAPRLLNRPHSISVELQLPPGGADGVLFSMGGNDGGFSIYVLDGVFTYGYNYMADSYFHVRSSGPLPAGLHVLSVDFRPTGPADLAAGVAVGHDPGSPAMPDYQPPFAWPARSTARWWM